ncbi:tetratricopeptide repeat-containing sulfotransferase family protein [Flavimaricola marinus]|uniref:Sulfotransferase domain protein n=1 Tax=Flavimaricola marinus TaxID=1819565 RepID=A0A238LGQ0_9RHOB|nr:sulfotransferase [Flavimaricola marinus]SMY08723.1 Sulfotransferase domain protein [Flavimaricola marinus]
MLDKAKALASAGRLQEAAKLYDKLIADKPRNAVILAGAIQFHNRYSRQFPKALALSETLLTLKPKAVESHILAAESALNCQRLRAALDHAETALRLAPDQPDALFIAAAVDMALNRHEAASGKLEAALRRDPDHLPSRIQLARAMQSAGQLTEAEAMVRSMLDAHPDNATLLPLLFSVATMSRDDPHVRRLTESTIPALRKLGGPPLADALRLLAKAQTDFGDHEAAFATTTEAKAAAPMQRDTERYADFIDAQCSKIDARSFDRPGGSDSDRPVLIVGMPRSGSTLLEQMLAQHPQIESVGESPALRVMTQELRMGLHVAEDMIRAIREVPEAAAARLAVRYLEETAPMQPGTTRVIDKSLHNFELLGFFAKLLPKGRIIHVLRDPLDTCVSCYLQPLSPWHSYTQDLQGLGRAYMQHRQLMDHWAEVLPNPVTQVRYEALVTEPEQTLRGVLEGMGLPWDDNCLAYEQSANRSKTLSASQVRKPLYQKAIQRWRQYEAHLGPLKEELRPLYPDGWTESYR